MHNSQQISSSDSNSHDRLDFQRFQGIWNNIKKAKQSINDSHYYDKYDKQSSNKDKQSINNYNNNRSNNNNRINNNRLNSSNNNRQSSNKQLQQSNSNNRSIKRVKKAIQQQQQKNIQTRLILTQKQLKKSKQNTNLLLKKLSQAQQQIQYLQYELQKQIKQKQQLKQQLNLMIQNNKYINIHQNNHINNIQDKQKQTYRQIQRQLNKQLQLKQRQVDKLNLKIKSLQLNIKNQQNQLKLLNDNNKIINKKLQQSHIKHQQDYLKTNIKGTQFLQLEQAYTTIQRLMLLLRNTQEYKNFSLLMQDFKDLHFMKNIQHRLKKNELLHKIPYKKVCTCMQIKMEQKLLWSPSLCYKKVLQLKLKYERLTQQCIQQLLFELNKIYLSKQQSEIQSIKELYQVQISRLKKKTQIRYDQLVARKQIQRLKKQIQIDKYNIGNKNKNISENYHIHNIQIYKAIGQYEDQLRLKQKQIILLKQRIKLMQNQNNSYDKILYLQGTLWIIDKVLLQLQHNNQDLQLFQSKFRQRITNQNILNNDDWINNFKYFFQNITQTQNTLLQKLLMMKQSTINKMGNHQNQNQNNMRQTEYQDNIQY